MKSFELFLFYHDTLASKRDEVQTALEEADEADRLAWQWYENLPREQYEARPDYYNKIVDDTHSRVLTLTEQLASLQEAITHAKRLEEELEFLEDEGVLAHN